MPLLMFIFECAAIDDVIRSLLIANIQSNVRSSTAAIN